MNVELETAHESAPQAKGVTTRPGGAPILPNLEAAAGYLTAVQLGTIVIAMHEASHVEPVCALLERLADRLHRPPVLLALDFEVALELQARRMSVVTPEELIQPADYDGLQQEAMALGATWFLSYSQDGRTDLTRSGPMSLGGLVEWEMSYVFAEAMRCIVHVQRVVERLRPSLILFPEPTLAARRGLLRQEGEDFHRLAAETVCGPQVMLVRVTMPRTSRLPRRHRLMSWLKRRLKDTAGHLLHRLMGWPLVLPGLAPRQTRPLLVSGAKHIGTDVGKILVRDHRAAVIIAEDSWSLRAWRSLMANRGGTWQMPASTGRLSREARDRIEAVLQRMTAVLDRRRERLSALTFRGVSLTPFLGDRLRYLQETRWRELLTAIERWRRYLRTRRIGVVVVSQDLTTRKKLLVRVAQQLGIPTVVAQHGMYVDPLSEILHADYVAVWGNSAKRFLETAGIATRRIRVVGATRFDRLASLRRRRPQIRRAVCHELGLDPGRPVVLLTTQGVQKGTYFVGSHFSVRENYAMCRAALEAARRLPQAQLIIKFHITEPNARRIEAALAQAFGPERVRCVQQADIYRLLCAADCLVTAFSTTGLEAIGCQVPVVELRLRQRPYWVSYAAAGAALEARSVDELEQALRRILGGSEEALAPLRDGAERCWRDSCGYAVGEASHRLAEFMLELRDGK